MMIWSYCSQVVWCSSSDSPKHKLLYCFWSNKHSSMRNYDASQRVFELADFKEAVLCSEQLWCSVCVWSLSRHYELRRVRKHSDSLQHEKLRTILYYKHKRERIMERYVGPCLKTVLSSTSAWAKEPFLERKLQHKYQN